MGKSKPQTTNTTSTNNPWAGAIPILNQVASGAQTAYGATPKDFASLYAGQNQLQKDAISSATGVASTAGVGSDQLRQLGLSMVAPDYTDPTKNATLQHAISASLQPLEKGLHQRVLSIGDAAQMAGAYGGSRQGVVEGTALGDFNNTAANTSAAMNYQYFNDASQRQQNAGALFEQATKLGLAPSQILEAAGAAQQQQDQAAKDAAAAAPWSGLDNLMSASQIFAPYASNVSTGVATGAQGSKAAGAAKGAIGGASAGSIFGPVGAGIGAVIGGLGGLFG